VGETFGKAERAGVSLMGAGVPDGAAVVYIPEPWAECKGVTKSDKGGGFFTLHRAIRYPGGEMEIKQRCSFNDDSEKEAHERISLIVRAVNACIMGPPPPPKESSGVS
jgi:hypothetical protein